MRRKLCAGLAGLFFVAASVLALAGVWSATSLTFSQQLWSTAGVFVVLAVVCIVAWGEL